MGNVYVTINESVKRKSRFVQTRQNMKKRKKPDYYCYRIGHEKEGVYEAVEDNGRVYIGFDLMRLYDTNDTPSYPVYSYQTKEDAEKFFTRR